MIRIWLTLGIILAIAPVVASSGFWLDVPFVKQEGEGCGAACISMVMQYWAGEGHDISPGAFDPQRIMQLLYSKQAAGIYASDMGKYFRDHGFRTFIFAGNGNDLQSHLQKGRPLIICLNINNKETILHYVVVAGIRPDEGVVLLNDPADKKLAVMEWQIFEKAWKAMQYWTLLALPKNSR
jgi:ABC-type bacteriocin/lantibiotic exporter with double-glycine peptidase domain